MSELWAAIDTRSTSPRILVTNAGKEPLVKARMRKRPDHRRALATLLEGLAMWEGARVRAVLVAGMRDACVSSFYHDCFADPCDTPLYSIGYAPSLEEARQMHEDRIRGMGAFNDMRQVLTYEVAK